LSDTGLTARRAAWAMLNAVTEDGRLMADLVAGPLLAALDPADRARAQRLASDALRGADRADRLLKPLLSRAPPGPARNLLRLGVVELAHGGAAHGVVNAAVGLIAGDRRLASFKGLVNAVLRRLAPGLPDRWAALPPGLLPPWLRQPLVAAWGRADVAGMEAAHQAGATLDLTARDDAAAVAALTGGRVTPTGSVRLTDPGQVSLLPGFADGAWWVQDAAAALPARVLAPAQGEAVLDLCAAPGGKTLQLAAMGAVVTAVDQSAGRMDRVRQNLDRCRLTADLVVADALEFDRGGWSAILLDAPCSATGTIRRHPDLPYAKDGSGISDLIALQARLIDHALTLLAPGGRLVFCTCSVIPDEGEVQVTDALARHPGLTVDPGALALPGFDPGWITPDGILRTLPGQWAEIGGWDGFAIALLRKPA
jgi:16S rRNA (cytosine967-C5)-methyltransferase